MRGSEHRAIVVDVSSFGWHRAVVSILRHSTLPWYDEFASEIHLDATHLGALRKPGARDGLSLTAQFAAHLAFLQFAGISDAAFDANEWVVIRKRGSDCRLVRIAARSRGEEPPPALTLIQEFASAIDAPSIDVLRQSWTRAETAYHEIESQLRSDAAADLRWLHASAAGAVRSSSNVEALRALATLDDSIVILGHDASPLVRYSAIRSLSLPQSLDEHSLVERIAESDFAHKTFVIVSPQSFDESSKRVVDLLRAAGVGVWRESSDKAKPFLLSPLLRAMPSNATCEWVERFVHSTAFGRYLDEGELPVAANENAVASLREPIRSFIAAIALLGVRIPITLVDRFLERLLSTARATDLATDGVCSIRGEEFAFATDEVRRQMIQVIPAASRAALTRIGEEVLSGYSSVLESRDWASAEEAIRTLRALPRSALSEPLKRTLSEALFATGRYRDARDFASEVLLARIERRMGDYNSALARLENLETSDFESDLLRAELLLLLDRADEAKAALQLCGPTTDEQRSRLDYRRAVAFPDSAIEVDHPYYGPRIAVYRAIAARDLTSAIVAAHKAIDAASAVHDRVDATLDLIFALFCSGDWNEARAVSLDALLLVDQTQGDRAAGGILFTLAFLAADDGQCTHAMHIVERLRKFYGDVRDEKRLAELEMLAAAIDFSRGRFTAAFRAAQAALSTAVSDQIREAAALIADEIDWIQQRDTPLRSTGATANIELSNRHALLRARRGLPHSPLHHFTACLLAWEHGGAMPDARTGSEKLMLYRAALGRGRTDVSDALAVELHIEPIAATEAASDSELRLLRAAAALPFPFEKDDFAPARWRFASRNRLGQWQAIGSLAALPGAELDAALASPPADWIACSDRELLYVEGLSIVVGRLARSHRLTFHRSRRASPAATTSRRGDSRRSE